MFRRVKHKHRQSDVRSLISKRQPLNCSSRSRQRVEERLCTCPKMVGCNEPITARSSRFPSWLRRVRIPILCSSSKWDHHRTRHSSYHHLEQKKPATIPGLTITGRGEVSVISIGQHDPPRALYTLASRPQRREEGSEGRSVPEHRSHRASLPCPGLTLLCPGRVRGRLDPTQRVTWGPQSPLVLALRRRCEVVRCAVWAPPATWLRRCCAARSPRRSGWRMIWQPRPSFLSGLSATCPVLLNFVLTTSRTNLQRADGARVKSPRNTKVPFLRLRYVDMSW